jgi:hypothetical protein
MNSNQELVRGDYVLASKYDDGHLGDHWFVGWFEGMTDHVEPRYDVVDNDGELARGNGFRRAERITPFVGKTLIERAKSERWEQMSPTGSVWSKRSLITLEDPDPLAMIRMVGHVWYIVETLRYDKRTTKLRMKSGVGQIQTKLVADEMLESTILSMAYLMEGYLGDFIKDCRAMAPRP